MSISNQNQDKYLLVDNVKLHYLDWGGKGETLLFLAGQGDTAYTFQRFAPRFNKQFHTIGLTRRGFGKSDAPEGSYDLDTFVDDIYGFLNALGILKVSIVGHSYAGYEMTQFALQYPEKINKLVYLDAIWIITNEEIEARANDPVNKKIPEISPADALKSIDMYYKYIRKLRPDFDRMWSPLIEKMILQHVNIESDGTVKEIKSNSANEAMIKSAVEYNVNYSGITSPMLCIYVVPQEHPFVPHDASREYCEQMRRYYMENIFPYKQRSIDKLRSEKKDAIIYELPGADHFCHISNEDEVYSCVYDFLLN